MLVEELPLRELFLVSPTSLTTSMIRYTELDSGRDTAKHLASYMLADRALVNEPIVVRCIQA